MASAAWARRRPWRSPLDKCGGRSVRALAADPRLEPTSTAARVRFDLGAPSTVAKALGVLVGRELLTREAGRYSFDDPFFRRWVERHTLADLGLTAE